LATDRAALAGGDERPHSTQMREKMLLTAGRDRGPASAGGWNGNRTRFGVVRGPKIVMADMEGKNWRGGSRIEEAGGVCGTAARIIAVQVEPERGGGGREPVSITPPGPVDRFGTLENTGEQRHDEHWRRLARDPSEDAVGGWQRFIAGELGMLFLLEPRGQDHGPAREGRMSNHTRRRAPPTATLSATTP